MFNCTSFSQFNLRKRSCKRNLYHASVTNLLTVYSNFADSTTLTVTSLLKLAYHQENCKAEKKFYKNLNKSRTRSSGTLKLLTRLVTILIVPSTIDVFEAPVLNKPNKNLIQLNFDRILQQFYIFV